MAHVFNEQAHAAAPIQPGSDAAHLAAQRMETYGGGFASHIGAAYFLADSANKRALVEAFRPLFERFASLA